MFVKCSVCTELETFILVARMYICSTLAYAYLNLCVRACVRVCVRVCVCACVCVCVYEREREKG